MINYAVRCVAVTGSPEVPVVRVYLLPVHRRQSEWASSAYG